jgi:predicted secreted protein
LSAGRTYVHGGTYIIIQIRVLLVWWTLFWIAVSLKFRMHMYDNDIDIDMSPSASRAPHCVVEASVV